MDKSIKCLLMDVDNVIISEVVEVDAQLGDPNCKMINPYLFRRVLRVLLGMILLLLQKFLVQKSRL